MPKITIYVGDELKADMDRMGDAMNWSRYAQRAFSAAIEQESWKTMSDDMQAAIVRLKTSKAAAQVQGYEDGKTAGRLWAMNEAAYPELVTVSNLPFGGEKKGHDTPKRYADLLQILDTMTGKANFVSNHAPNRLMVTGWEFGNGFVEGAREFLAEVNDQL